MPSGTSANRQYSTCVTTCYRLCCKLSWRLCCGWMNIRGIFVTHPSMSPFTPSLVSSKAFVSLFQSFCDPISASTWFILVITNFSSVEWKRWRGRGRGTCFSSVEWKRWRGRGRGRGTCLNLLGAGLGWLFFSSWVHASRDLEQLVRLWAHLRQVTNYIILDAKSFLTRINICLLNLIGPKN